VRRRKAERTIPLKSLGSRRARGGTQQVRIRGANYPPGVISSLSPGVISSLSPAGGIPQRRRPPAAPGDPHGCPGVGGQGPEQGADPIPNPNPAHGGTQPTDPRGVPQSLVSPHPRAIPGDTGGPRGTPPAPLRKAPCPPPREAPSFFFPPSLSPNLCHLGLIGFPGSHGEIKKSPNPTVRKNQVIHGELRERAGGSRAARTHPALPAAGHPDVGAAGTRLLSLSGLLFSPPRVAQRPPPGCKESWKSPGT